MNKFKKISIITIILYLFFINVSLASEAIIDVSAARLREEANTTSKVLTNIYKGEKVEILEKNDVWVKYEGMGVNMQKSFQRKNPVKIIREGRR